MSSDKTLYSPKLQDKLHLPPSGQESLNIQSAKDAQAYIEQQGIEHIKIGIFDLNGVLRGKYISKEKFLSGLQHPLGFCDVILGVDIDDQLIDNLHTTSWHSAYPDAQIALIPESARILPFEKKSLFFLAEFIGSHQALCPRSLLKKVVQKAHDMGFEPYAALEYEFSVFDETSKTVREKNYSQLNHFSYGNCGYSILRNSVDAEYYESLLEMCNSMDMKLEGLHTEIGPGMLEAALCYDQALLAADKAGLFKTFSKVLWQRNGKMATFMAKYDTQEQGHSGHTHISLRDLKNNCIFYDEKAPHQMSKTMQHFLAGCQKYLPELLALVTPNINSFARLVPGFWAPTQASWGVDNRTCALRVITATPSAQRIEYRIPGADSNPYLAISAALASGLWGIEQKLPLSKPTLGNAYKTTLPQAYQLPRTLYDAAQALKASGQARETFGDTFVEDYAQTLEHEVLQAQQQVTNWQLARYFELV